VLEQQVLITLQKIIQHLIIQTTLVKTAHLTVAHQALAIVLQLLLEVDLVVVHQEVADLLVAAEQEVVVAINHHKKINAGLSDIQYYLNSFTKKVTNYYEKNITV
jgi:hypothetical protein